MRSFWQHSIACGIASRNFAILKGIKAPESFFVAGFLHDFGRLILLEHYPQKYAEVYDTATRKQVFIHEVEKELFGFTHADVGGELIRTWRLPAGLAEAIAYHHHPQKAHEYAELTAIVHIANVTVHACQFGFSGDQFVPVLSEEAWRLTGLKASVLEPAVNKTQEQLDELFEFLIPM